MKKKARAGSLEGTAAISFRNTGTLTGRHTKQSQRASALRKKKLITGELITAAAIKTFLADFEAEHGTRGAKKAAYRHFGLTGKTLRKRMRE